MAQDFSVEPFFDDYSEDKKFHRVLFRPGYAVQARELTQLQTILQEQIRRHGDHIFKEGAMVIPGQISYDLDLAYVQLQVETDSNRAELLKSLVGRRIKNSTGLIAKVVAALTSETVNGVFSPETLYVKYESSEQENNTNISAFRAGQLLTTDDDEELTVTVAQNRVITTVPITGFGCSASIQRGIYYIAKTFVLVQEQTVILDRYTNTPSYRVGLRLVESIVLPEEDESLLDNALGTPNFAAPGAARYKIDLQLEKIPEDSDQIVNNPEEEDFIDLLRLRNGKVIFKIDRTAYAEIEKTLARRTFDESGDYTVRPFAIQAKEFRNNFRQKWAAEEIYIQGDVIKVRLGRDDFFFVATTNGATSTTQPNWANYENVDNFVDGTVIWEYTLNPVFNNGVYSFPGGDSTYADFTGADHKRLEAMLVYAVEPGKAYVQGYEIEKVSTEYLFADKSRYVPPGSEALANYLGVAQSTLTEKTDAFSGDKVISIDLSMGAYVIVESTRFTPDLVNLPIHQLHSAVRTGISANTLLGTARIRGFERHSATQFKLFLFDIKLNAGKSFSNVKAIAVSPTATSAFACNVVQTNGVTTLRDPLNTGLIWQLPDYAVAEVNEVSYAVVAPLNGTPVNGTLELTAPAGYTFESVNNPNNYVVVNNTTGNTVDNPSLSIVNNNLRITGLPNNPHTVLATIERNDVTNGHTIRALTDAPPIVLRTAETAQARTINLKHSFVTRVVSVKMSVQPFTTPEASLVFNVDITNRYTLDRGQTIDGNYIGRLTLDSGATLPTGPIRIRYEYIDGVDSTAGDFSAVNSYTHNASRISYDQIPKFGENVLRDALDFRPTQLENLNFRPRYFPKFGTTGAFVYRHHFSRSDTISLESTGKFIVTRGIPAEFSIEASQPNNTMKIASCLIEPYTFFQNDAVGVIISKVENKRYTMRDIGRLERRIEDLEYYTALSLTEVDTKNLRIVDANGLDRFQNGFLVDTFDGQGVGNATGDDWNCAIDMQNKELRPFFAQKHVNLVEDKASSFATLPASQKYKVSGDIVTLPYTESVMITQNAGSVTENINPFAIYSFSGRLDINPWSDTWFATEYRPDIIVNDNSQYDAVVAKARADGILGTVWNSWQTVFSSTTRTGLAVDALGAWGFGRRDITTETFVTEDRQVRTGTNTFIRENVTNTVIDDRVVDTRVIPYIRPKTIMFEGFGFKPSTRIYAFFDNVPVDSFIIPATRIEYLPIVQGNGQFFPDVFDTQTNAGSNISRPERLMYHSDGVPIDGTVTVTNGSSTVTGSGTTFLEDIRAGDLLDFGDGRRFRVTSIGSDLSLTISPSYTGPTVSDVTPSLFSTRNVTEEPELAFTKGEVIREVNGNGNTAIVVGQELSGGKYYLYVLNIKGSGIFSTSSNSYLEGEYVSGNTNLKPRVRFIARTDSTTLVSTGSGLVHGLFKLPSTNQLRFRTGKRELTFSDSPANTSEGRRATESTSGSTTYEANGLIRYRQRTILSTRTAQIVQQQVSENRTLTNSGNRVVADTGWYDPLAQTFLVQQEGGAFITSVDIFFATKDNSLPVRLEIREVVNGYPSATILPFAIVEKKASDVKVDSIQGLAATTFTFKAPIYLENNTEYAIVLVSDSNNYRCWVAEADTIDVVTRKKILTQPYNGVLFKSQNGSTWTANQNQDLKFTLKRAVFTQAPVKLELTAPKLTFKDLQANPFQFEIGSRVCRVKHFDHGMVNGEKVILKSRRVAPATINGISKSNIFDVELTISNVELDSYVVTFGGTANAAATGNFGGTGIIASENYEFSTAMLEISNIIPEGTNINYEIKTVNHLDQIITNPIVPKDNLNFSDVRVYPSEVNYSNAQFPTGLSVIATLVPSPKLNSISPVIDLGRIGLTLVSNKVDSPTLDINNSVLDTLPVASNVEIEDAKAINLGNTISMTTFDTIIVSKSLASATTYDNFNKLTVGSVIRVQYTEVTNDTFNVIIVDKELDENQNIRLIFEGFTSNDFLVRTVGTQRATITWLSRFISEYAPVGSSTHSKYVTKKINFARPSDMIRILLDGMVPEGTDVEIYYKTAIASQSNDINTRYFKANTLPYTKNSTEFVSITANVEDLEPFDSLIVKIVMKSINKARVPRFKNLRVIACAA